MTRSHSPGSLLKEIDLTKEEFLSLVDHARALKADRHNGVDCRRLIGKNIALIFEKSSTRTRCAFEVAAHDEGAHVTYLDPAGSHLGKDESVPDTARVLGRMFDGIEFRGYDQETVEQLAEHSGVPVFNGLTDQWHPTQMLADVMTMVENHTGPIESIVLCYTGDGRSNVARSLLVTGALLGFDVRIATPQELRPPQDVVQIANELAATSGARFLITDELPVAMDGADFVYTDVWVSMGEAEAQWGQRIPLLLPYRVTAEVLKSSHNPDIRFLHCLPAVHDRSTALGRKLFDQFGLDGAEVDDEVFSSPASVVIDQAENRMHTIRAVLVNALGT